MKEVELTRGLVALVDDEDFELVSTKTWHALCGSKVYAASSGSLYMHRFLMGDPAGLVVDHHNGHTLDNRRFNLRIATLSQNSANLRPRKVRAKSGFKGVFEKSSGWAARTTHNGKQIHLGLFDTPEEAAQAYDTKVRELHGEFATTNFDSEQLVVTRRAKVQIANPVCPYCLGPMPSAAKTGPARLTCSEHCRRMNSFKLQRLREAETHIKAVGVA